MFIPIEKDRQTHIYIIDKPINHPIHGYITTTKMSELSVNYVPLQKPPILESEA